MLGLKDKAWCQSIVHRAYKFVSPTGKKAIPRPRTPWSFQQPIPQKP
jgi:hypothetical protein